MSITIKPSKLTATELYLKGREAERKQHDEAEKKKVGTLRGGSSGCITDNEDIYGTCSRVALSRFLGYQAPVSEGSYTWFDAGFANENAWLEKLLNTGYTIKSEDECGIKWKVEDVDVTGRPDIMVFDGDEPLLGLELKVVCTVNSAVNVYCKDEPKIENLLQAAHYSMITKVPFTLVYSYRSRAVVPGWATKYKDSLYLSYEKTFESKNGKKFTKREYSIDPFIKEFKLGFEDGSLYYETDKGKRVDTKFTAAGIERYYRHIVDMEIHKYLGDRVASKDLNGELLPYNKCTNCPLLDACDRYEHNYEAWVDKIKLICGENND